MAWRNCSVIEYVVQEAVIKKPLNGARLLRSVPVLGIMVSIMDRFAVLVQYVRDVSVPVLGNMVSINFVR